MKSDEILAKRLVEMYSSGCIMPGPLADVKCIRDNLGEADCERCILDWARKQAEENPIEKWSDRAEEIASQIGDSAVKRAGAVISHYHDHPSNEPYPDEEPEDEV